MVDKKLCDICSKEIPFPKDHFTPFKGGLFTTERSRLEVCLTCSFAVEKFIQELKERYRLMEAFKKNPKEIKDQKSLDDFE